MPVQTVETQIRLLLEEQSGQDLPCFLTGYGVTSGQPKLYSPKFKAGPIHLRKFTVYMSEFLSMPMGLDYVVIGFDMEVQPLVTHNAARPLCCLL